MSEQKFSRFSDEAITRAVAHLGPLPFSGFICGDATNALIVHGGEIYLCPCPCWNPPRMGIDLGAYDPRLAALLYLNCRSGGVDRYAAACALAQYDRPLPPELAGIVIGGYAPAVVS